MGSPLESYSRFVLVVVKILSVVLRFESVSSQYQFLCVDILVQPFLYVFIKFLRTISLRFKLIILIKRVLLICFL